MFVETGALIHGEITSTKSLYPRLGFSPFPIQRTDWDIESLETAHILSVPPESPPAAAAAAAAATAVTHFTSGR